METTLSATNALAPSKTALWAGRIISAICILFLLFDAIGKIIKETHTIQACIPLGIPENTIQAIGIILLICTIFYIIPRTSVFGALLLTGYLGGATAIMVRAGQPVYFSLVFALLVWLGLYLRDSRTRAAFRLFF